MVAILDKFPNQKYDVVVSDLFKKLARSDVLIKPSMGTKNLLCSLAGGSLFIIPEEMNSIDILIDTNRKGSEYKFRESKQEGFYDSPMMFSLFGIPNWTFHVNRKHNDSHGFSYYKFNIGRYTSYIPEN